MQSDLLSVVLFDDIEKGKQYRLSISEFRRVNYLSIREWYLSFDGSFAPTTNGVTVPYTLHTASRMFNALKVLLSDAETLETVRESDVTFSELSSISVLSEVMKTLGVTEKQKLKIVTVDDTTVTIGVEDVED